MPQIEIMQSDLPHTLYSRNGGKKVTQSDVDEATRKMKEAYERKMKKREMDEGMTLREIFEGAKEMAKEE